ncbi:MAG: APC family permease [Candidatus Odinarchaeota archaeon]
MATTAEGTVFVRKASGLTRAVSGWDALIYATVNPGVLHCMNYIIWGPALYPGADMPLAVSLVFMMFPIAGLYVLLSISMPRSGGEYIYVSRIISPLWGLFACWTLTIIGISWGGVLTNWTINWGAGYIFLNNGIASGNTTLVNIGLALNNEVLLIFGVGSIILALSFYAIYRGVRTFIYVCWAEFFIAVIGLIAYAVACFNAGPAVFQSRLLAVSGINYTNDILIPAQSLGWTPGYSLLATIACGATYVNLNTLGNTYTTNMAGEIKNVTRAQPLAVIGSLCMLMVFWEVMYGSSWVGTGGEFWGAISTLDWAGVQPFGVHPSPAHIVLYMTDNPVLLTLVPMGFMASAHSGAIGLPFGPVRNLFAWSFDGILPNAINKVNRKGSPYAAVLLGAAMAYTFFLLNTFTSVLYYINYAITTWFIGWFIVGIAGILFPYRQRAIFQKSPSIVQIKLGSIPLITVLGALTAGLSAYIVYASILPVVAGGYQEAIYLISTVMFLCITPVVLYYVATWYRRRQGIPIDLRFKDIPPD